MGLPEGAPLPNQPPDIFYYTEGENVTNSIKTSRLEYIDFKTLMRHEIGHWLGFAHQSVCPNAYQHGIMRVYGIKPYEEIKMNGDNPDYAYDDRCMFMKMYCCSTNGVDYEKELEGFDFSIAPNPSQDEIDVKCTKPMLNEDKFISILDLDGKQINSKMLSAGLNDTKIDIQNLPSGNYVLSISFSKTKGMIGRLFTVTK
jgi:hypothetical protein